jgi:Ca-activated chloride channel family protein
MDLLVPAALAFGLIIPIILAFYFMRPKRQERVIGSTLLWQQAMQEMQASKPWQRLRLTPLLLLQLLAAVVIVLVLTRPAIFSTSSISGDTIIILQSSASMQATDVSPTRFDEAKNRIEDFISNLGSNDRLSLITMARTPQVLIAESQDKARLTAALQDAQVSNQDADLEQALSLASSLAEGRSNVQVLVIGDGHVMNPDRVLTLSFPVRYLSIGTDTPNAALLALSSRTLSGNLIAFAQVANYSHQVRAIPVELYADSRLIGVRTISLAAGANGAIEWGPLPATARFLHAHIITQDAMTVDHDAWSIIGSSLRGRVLLVTKENHFLETALRLQSNINLFETTPAQYNSSGIYDLTIFDGFVPLNLPSGALFFIDPPKGSYLFGTSGASIHVSHINAGKDNENILTNVDLSSIHTLQDSHQLQPAAWAQSVVVAPETPLLAAGENNNRRVAVMGFDLHATDLPLQPAFPILVQNITNWFLPPPVPGDGQVTAGLPVTVQTWPGADQVTISTPGQQTTTIGPPFPVEPFADTNQVGVYKVSQRVHQQSLQGAFTVNLFDPIQSRLTPAKSLPIANSTSFTNSGNTVSHQLREIWPWIAAFLLLVLCFEWWLFSRGYRLHATSPARHDPGSNQARGTSRQRKTSRYAFITDLQDQWYEYTGSVRKRILKATRKSRRRMTKRPPTPSSTSMVTDRKRDKRVNI